MGHYVTVIKSTQNDYGAVIVRLEVIIDFPDAMPYTLMLPNADRNRMVIKTIFEYITEHAKECDEPKEDLSLLCNRNDISWPLGG